MSETLLQFKEPVRGADGALYEARACAAPMPEGGTWQGWIEFIPVDGGDPVRSPRETTQPNRIDTEYWATGLGAVYLEGALRRALEGRGVNPVSTPQPSVFNTPAPAAGTPMDNGPASILDPFSVYEKGEALLRKQLAALSAWHLVNIAVEYELTDLNIETLNRLPATELVEVIAGAVKAEADRSHPA